MNTNYLAFISYRHADNIEEGRQWATWLQQAIESYEVPGDLVGHLAPNGKLIPARIAPIFRDEEDLPVHHNLGSAIQQALKISDTLIVVCSPQAVESQYVADEITFFKRQGGAERILALIIDGEPNVSLDAGKIKRGGSISDECFPSPLQFHIDNTGELSKQRTEPLSADFRFTYGGKKHQGWTNPEALRDWLKYNSNLSTRLIEEQVEQYKESHHKAFLKIVAGLLGGIPLIELTQRDKAYQLKQERLKARRLRQWLCIVAILAVVAIGLGVTAERQRQISLDERQKTQEVLEATRLSLEFMTFELRDVLKGHVPIADRSSVLEEMGRLLDLLGSYSKENNRDARLESLSLTQMAHVQWQSSNGSLTEALSLQRQVTEIVHKLVLSEPKNPKFLRDFAIAYQDLARIELISGRMRDAVHSTLKAIEGVKKLIALEPEIKLHKGMLTQNLAHLGSLQILLGDLQAGVKNTLESLTTIRNLINNADTSTELLENMFAVLRDSTVAARYGEVGNQRDISSEMLSVATQLLEASPASLDYQINLSEALSYRAEAAFYDGDIDAAREGFIEALRMAERVASSDPQNKLYSRSLAESIDNVGWINVAEQNYKEGLSYFVKALELRQVLLSGNPEDHFIQQDIVTSHQLIADALMRNNERRKARESYILAINKAKSLIESYPDDLYTLGIMARSYMGRAYLESGQQSIEAARSATRIYNQILEVTDYDKAALFGLLQTYIELGSELEPKDTDQAQHVYLKALKISKRLIELAPKNINYINASISVNDKLGKLALLRSNLLVAEGYFKVGLDLALTLSGIDASSANTLDKMFMQYMNVAKVQSLKKESKPAIQSYLSALRVIKKIYELNATDTAYLQAMLEPIDAAAELIIGSRDFKQAQALYIERISIVEKAIQVQPLRPYWLYELAISYEGAGDVETKKGATNSAKENYIKASEYVQQVISSFTESTLKSDFTVSVDSTKRRLQSKQQKLMK